MANKRENNFGPLRLLAALMVIRGHMQHLTGTGAAIFFGSGVESIGVKILFLIGGYLITKSWLSDPHAGRYAVKRVLRIWPPLAVNTLFSMFVIGAICTELPLSEYFSSAAFWDYLRVLRLYIVYPLPGVFNSNPYPVAVNGSLWSLPVEVLMYVAVAFFLFVFAKLGRLTGERTKAVGMTALWCVSVFLMLYMMYPGSGWTDHIIYGMSIQQAMCLIPYYLLGSICAIWVPRSAYHLPAAVLVFLLANCFLSGNLLFEVVRMVVLAYLVFSFAFAAPVIRVPRALDISYGVYLYGFPVQQAIVYFAIQNGIAVTSPNLVTLASLVVLIPLGLLSEFLVERPAGKLSKAICKTCFPKREAAAK